MNIESAKAAHRVGALVPNPKAKLRDQFHEVARLIKFHLRGNRMSATEATDGEGWYALNIQHRTLNIQCPWRDEVRNRQS